MKTTLKLVLAAAIFAFSSNVSAQELKLAHIDMQELIMSMPEYEEAMAALQKVGEDLEQELELMQVELNRNFDDFQRNQESLSDLVRQTRIEAIQRLQERIQIFQQQAQESYQMEWQRLMQPVQEKAHNAVEAVAEAQGITHVFNSQALLFTARNTIDLLPAVRQHLGIRN